MQAEIKIIAPVIMLSINNQTIISAHLNCHCVPQRIADTAMNFQEVQKLFDFQWFEHQIFDSKSIASQPVDANEESQDSQQLTKNLSSPSFVIRSFSDQNLSFMDSSNSEQSHISPSSVLQIPKLQTIQSGKEEFEGFDQVGYKELGSEEGEVADKSIQKELDSKRKRRRRKRSSKSLSELEIEELKGFMDLGFEFKDADKDSNLVLIVPGLQRLGKEDEEGKKEIVEEESRVSRPYLSEAWDVFEKKNNLGRKNQQLLMNWRLPASGDEMELKNHLKFWAQTIASNVR